MVNNLRDKVVVITGGAVGIGAKVIEYMLEEGIKHISFLDINEAGGVLLQDEMSKRYGADKIKYHKCDVTNDEQLFGAFESVTKEYGYIDIVVNNAGIMNDSLRLYRLEIQLNVTTLVTSTLKAIEWMSKEKGGKGGIVINISSVAAIFQDCLLPVYFATKSAVLQFSNCIGLPQYYSRTGVKVIAICFGTTDTALLTKDKMGSFDTEMDNNMVSAVQSFPFQRVESAARGLVDACKLGESGSTWLAANDQPVLDISDTIKQGYGIMAEAFIKQLS